MTELCQELRNWFEREMYIGEITIHGGALSVNGKSIEIPENAFFRVIGSLFADGIHKQPDTHMQDEQFPGAVWLLAIPAPVINLATEIAAWRAKYETADSAAMSPFSSESFGGYSYSKSAGNSEGSGGGLSWVNQFRNRMNAWRKI